MVTHYKVDGHLACGTHGEHLASSKELARVKCRNCRNTDAFKQARRDTRNAARRAARKARSGETRSDWRGAWQQHLSELPGRNRLPRGFAGQPYV
ncbi:hypothetical protein [Phytopseudomonas dryadis]|uniref:Uncharacterized protein n=1 Tax=Phytopseudomonas dryadis TaxID=2487520 RepID=A0A4Q9QSS6_9GAMM|nr:MULTISPECIES: hypothetical protein [Pseudomonas]TBU84427.1 hypothetical protein DNK44_25340 [Pseudomonas dryadis]TBV01526.1 hypothetical protein DNK34_21025 [Pseudomonas dryadis]TBV19401.1 hypothetical protein DNK41_02380 [Pseudomonas sp. FRB 230]